MTYDERIPPLTNAAILTDTKIRAALAPTNAKAKAPMLEVSVPVSRIDQMAVLLAAGDVHLQIKAGFGPERRIILSPVEAALIYDLLDRFIAELPRAQKALQQDG